MPDSFIEFSFTPPLPQAEVVDLLAAARVSLAAVFGRDAVDRDLDASLLADGSRLYVRATDLGFSSVLVVTELAAELYGDERCCFRLVLGKLPRPGSAVVAA